MANSKKPPDVSSAYRTAYLIAGYLKDALSPDERDELAKWRLTSEKNEALFKEYTAPGNIEKWKEDYVNVDTEGYLAKSKLQLQLVRRKHRVRKVMYTAAAACLLIAIGSIFFFNSSRRTEPSVAITHQPANDLLPGVGGANLKLPDGTFIPLNAQKKDTVMKEEMGLHLQESSLSYSNPHAVVEWHELSVGRKGYFKLQLSDGTNVWLNSSSSIKFPTKFTGGDRRVEVTGETYFEVAKDKAHPFRVQVNGNTVEAIGTAFNINAYPDEEHFTTTLVEGKVKLSSANDSIMLSPDHTATLTNGRWAVSASPVTAITAWKDGKFIFRNTPLPIVMRQLSRWYDADIKYVNPVEIELNGTISRDVPLSRILSLLQQTEAVHFKIEGKTINVLK